MPSSLTTADCPYFYPRSPCGERPLWAWTGGLNYEYFYPRSPCGERLDNTPIKAYNIIFLSTLSLRRATTTLTYTAYIAPHFYPRSPCGERQFQKLHQVRHMQFLSTLSLRRATRSWTHWPTTRLLFLSTLSLRRATSGCGQYYIRARISIHALLAESDRRT